MTSQHYSKGLDILYFVVFIVFLIEYTVLLQTGPDDNMGTQDEVSIVVYGTKRTSEPISLGSGQEDDYFQPGKTDEIQVRLLEMYFDEKSILVQVMAWCCQATSHDLNQKKFWTGVYQDLQCLMASLCYNSLRPSDTIWRHRSMSTLAQIMVCCLTAPSHYLNQCWLIKSPQYTGGDFMFLYRFVRRRRRRRRSRRRPQILVHAITFEQLFGFLSFLAWLLALTYRLTD